MKNFILIGLGAVLLTGCTVTSKSGGDYASLSILSDSINRGKICKAISISEENELLNQLEDDSTEVLMIDNHLVEKYGKLTTMECYTNIISFHNRQAAKMLGEVLKEEESEQKDIISQE